MTVLHFRKGHMKIKHGYYYLDYYNNTGNSCCVMML